MRLTTRSLLALPLGATVLLAAPARGQQAPFTHQEVMIPVRDGVHLQTAILTPTNKTGPLPILFRRTPYGVPDQPPAQVPTSMKELAQDGYILVIQNLRGRFKSEGVFKLTSQVDLADSSAANETTDAYDSIDWFPQGNTTRLLLGVAAVTHRVERGAVGRRATRYESRRRAGRQPPRQ